MTINDDHAGEDGSIVATINGGDGYEVGSESSAEVIVTDHEDREARRALTSAANQAVFSDVVGSSAARVLETVTNRVISAFTAGSGIQLEFGLFPEEDASNLATV